MPPSTERLPGSQRPALARALDLLASRLRTRAPAAMLALGARPLSGAIAALEGCLAPASRRSPFRARAEARLARLRKES